MPDKIGFYDVGDRYDLSDSENEYDEREKRLLKGIRDRKGKSAAGGQEEVLVFDEGDNDDGDDDEFPDDEDDFNDRFEHDSDIEDKEDHDDLPDRKAWGSKARAFYGADYVDQDYDSLTAQEEERAQLEEIEAKEIQQRLAKELNEADFSLDVFVPEQEEAVEERKGKSKKKDKTEIKLKADLSDLSERQKRELFRKEAPEFDGLVEDFERNLEECHAVLEPVLKYLREKDIKDHPFVELLKTRYDLCLSYCNNISFYLLLKSNKSKVKNHPVVKRMVQMKQLLLELEQKYENSIKAQVETILEHITAGDELVFGTEHAPLELAKKPKGKKRLTMLEGVEEGGEKLAGEEGSEEEFDESESESDSDEPTAKKVRLGESDSEEEEQGDELPQEDEKEEQMEDGKSKRKITYQMAKNKGLTARKKKDQRNIRVKNRRKFEKALVRRKGTVRPVRTETTRYAGEATGIKAFVRRSVKIK